MKTKLKLVFATALSFVMIMSVCSAKSLDNFDIIEDDVQRKLIIYGTPEDIKPGEGVRIEVLKKDMTSDEIADSYTDKEEIMENFILIRQVPADESGAYELSINMKNQTSGYFIVRINGEDNEIYFSTNADKDSVVSDLKAAVTVQPGETEDAAKERAIGELAAIFDLENPRSTTIKTFNITDEVVSMVTPRGFAEVFYGMVDGLTIDNFVERTNLSAYIAALNEDKISVVDYKDTFALDARYLDAYEDNLDESVREDFTNTYYYNKDYTTAEEISEAFNDGVLTSWCKAIKAWSDVEKIIETFGEDIDVDMDTYNSSDFNTQKKSKLYSHIADIEEFDSVDDFVDEVNRKIDELADSGTGGTGGGGIGGGSGSGSGSRPSSGNSGGVSVPGAGSNMTNPIIPTENVPNPDGSQTEEEPLFTDMTGYEWAEESVEALAEKGIVTGTGEGTFEPGRNVTREEMLVMILRSFEVEPGETKTDFTDAEADGWYNEYLAAAKEAGYVNGRPDGSFGVGEAVTREDAAVMAYNIAKAMGEEFDTSVSETFTDDEEVSEYAKEAVYALKNKGVINGKEEGVFAPKDVCTRAEAAKIIYTLIAE